jgi:hypothetical protein
MLFVPFLELKMKQNLKQVQNYSIGMGLACSHSISCALGGDITLKKSEKGLTSFAFKIPVTHLVDDGENLDSSRSSKSQKEAQVKLPKHQILFRNEKLREYLKNIEIQSFVEP